jgi:hypothetical protein
MPGEGPRRLADLLQAGRLGQLGREAAQRRELVEDLRTLLPEEEAAHLVAASTDADGRLVLSMDSASWAARVRYRARDLGRDEIRVRVLPRQTDRTNDT